jgi:imidazolonepropionase-like amidohydrolase
MADGRGVKVTAHSSRLAGARVCADAGVDSIEHGFDLDAGLEPWEALASVTWRAGKLLGEPDAGW